MQTIISGKRGDKFARFHEQLRLRGYSSYDEYLASPEWTAFKAWYAKSKFPQHCIVCKSKQFELHHWRYEDIGQDELHDVIPLCRDHHQQIHQHCEKFDVPLHAVPRQLVGCFLFHPARAAAAFRPFSKAFKASKRRNCPRCHRRISLQHRFENCFDCMKELRKADAIARAAERAKNPAPENKPSTKVKTQVPKSTCVMCKKASAFNLVGEDGICRRCRRTPEYDAMKRAYNKGWSQARDGRDKVQGFGTDRSPSGSVGNG